MRILEHNQPVDVRNRFPKLRVEEKTYVLSLLAHEITLRARGAYPNGEQRQENIQKLITFNELQHSISGHLRNILSHNKRYPHKVFIDILFETAENGACKVDLDIAFKFAFDRLRKLRNIYRGVRSTKPNKYA